MNFRDLKYLIAVAEQQHFGEAANLCHVSQPTLSTQLKKLEDELDVVIFERSSKQVLITPIGERVIAQARVILRELDTLKNLAQFSLDPLSGPFHLGIIPTLGPYLLPYVLRVVKKYLPALQLHLHEDKTASILQQVEAGNLDAVLLALPIQSSRCHVHPLFDEPFFVAVPIQHRYAKRAQLRPQDLRNETLLLLEEGHCLRDQALEICYHADLQPDFSFAATSLETLRHMVAAGNGITLLPALALQRDSRERQMAIIPFKSPSPVRPIAMLWRKKSPRALPSYKLARFLTRLMKTVLARQISLVN